VIGKVSTQIIATKAVMSSLLQFCAPVLPRLFSNLSPDGKSTFIIEGIEVKCDCWTGFKTEAEEEAGAGEAMNETGDGVGDEAGEDTGDEAGDEAGDEVGEEIEDETEDEIGDVARNCAGGEVDTLANIERAEVLKMGVRVPVAVAAGKLWNFLTAC
jgi:hypothetical protein